MPELTSKKCQKRQIQPTLTKTLPTVHTILALGDKEIENFGHDLSFNNPTK